jgi:diphthamide synthase (EF-2-diphthine--ammonia ligase)
MHGVRVELLENQAKSIGLPLEIMQIRNAKHGSLWKRDADYTGKIKNQGVTHSIFGDINLEDLRKYQEDKLATMGLEGVFHFGKCPPMIWYRNSLHWALKRLFALTSVTSTKAL